MQPSFHGTGVPNGVPRTEAHPLARLARPAAKAAALAKRKAEVYCLLKEVHAVPWTPDFRVSGAAGSSFKRLPQALY